MRRAISPLLGKASKTRRAGTRILPSNADQLRHLRPALLPGRLDRQLALTLGPNGEYETEFSVNTTQDGDQRYPSIAMDDNGDFVVAWSGNGVDDI